MMAPEGSLTWPVISAVFIWADTAAALNRRAKARTAAAQNEDVHRATNTKSGWREASETAGRDCGLSPESRKLVSPVSRGPLDCPMAHAALRSRPLARINDSLNFVGVWERFFAHLHLALRNYTRPGWACCKDVVKSWFVPRIGALTS